MIRRTLILTAAVVAGGMAMAETALADPPCGRGWRRGEYCGPRQADRRDWDRRDDWRRREAWRGDRGYRPPPGGYERPRPLVELNIR